MTDAELQHVIDVTDRSLGRMKQRLLDPPKGEMAKLRRLVQDLAASLSKLKAEQVRRKTQV